MDYLSSGLYYVSNYNIVNNANLFNFFVLQLKKQTEEERRQFVSEMNLLLGKKFVKQFKFYLHDKNLEDFLKCF